MPISVFAAGLGKLNVSSGIGEPLRAEIELISASPEELASLTANIATEEAYAAQGIERPASHNSIKVSVAKNSKGAPVLKLNSAQPISEPFLDMLLQVDWNSGRLLREYTVLLDPPGYTGELDNSAQTSSSAQLPMVKADPSEPKIISNIESAPSEAPADIKKSSRKARKSKPVMEEATETSADVASAAGGEEYVTKKGDTLSKIARDMQVDGVSLEQMLVGLYETNPGAFNGKNMNRLNVGQIIRAPSAETLSAISRKQAAREVKVQTQNWNAYRNKLAGIVADSAPMDAEATQSAGGKIKTAAEDKSMSSANGPKDVVKLSAGEVKGDSVESKALQAKVTALQEEVTAREKGLKEAQDRTSALEKQIADMQKLLALKNNAMNDMQKQAEIKVEAKPAPAENKPAEAQPVEKPAEPKPVEAATPVKPTEAKVVPTKPVPAPAPVAEQPGFLASLTESLDPTLLGGAGGLLALLGGGWMYLRNKRRKNLADFEQGIMTSGGLKANTVFGNTSSSSLDTGDTSFLTDFSQSASGGMIDTNDVDPIAEAEVYMAYGRDAQAEEILKDAISKEPKRYELHLKLLEMYAASKNMSAFETVSGELYTTLGADDPTWAKVAAIGVELEPNNPLYQGKSGAIGGEKSAKSSDKLDASDFSDSPLAAEADLAADKGASGKDMDFSFDNDALTKGFASDAIAETEAKSDGLASASVVATLGAAVASKVLDAPEAPKFDEGLSFDMGALVNEDKVAGTLDAVTEPFSQTMPNLEFPTFESEASEVASEKSMSFDAPAAATSFEIPTLDTEESALVSNTLETFPSLADGSFEADEEPNFGFEMTTITPPADAGVMDLSEISLDLDDKSGLNAHTATAEEPAEVETKLELVSAYIEMDDKEGAKELLAEVIKEGGASQRQRAEALMSKLA